MTSRYIIAKDIDREEYYVIDIEADGGMPEVIIVCATLTAARKEIEALLREAS